MNPPFLFGKMKASGDGLGHRCFQSHRSSASSFGTCTDPKLFRVLPQGRILPLYTVSTSLMVHSVWLKHCQRSANSSPGRSAFVMSSSKRMRSLISSFESAPQQLPPGQGRPISVAQLSRDRDLSRRVLDEEVLIHCLREDVAEVSPDLEHSVLGVGFRQIVKLHLQGELVQILQRSLVERIDEIPLDDELLHLCCFLLSVRLLRGPMSEMATLTSIIGTVVLPASVGQPGARNVPSPRSTGCKAFPDPKSSEV